MTIEEGVAQRPQHILIAGAGSPRVWRGLPLSLAGRQIRGFWWGSRGQPEPPSTLALPWEAPRTLSKALSVLLVTTDRVVSHCNSGIQFQHCKNLANV